MPTEQCRVAIDKAIDTEGVSKFLIRCMQSLPVGKMKVSFISGYFLQAFAYL